MSSQERNDFLKLLRDMLKRMHYNLKAKGVNWEYKTIPAIFFGPDCSTASTPSSGSYSNRTITPAHNDESTQNENVPTQPTLYLEKAITDIDRDTLVSLLKNALQKAGGGTSIWKHKASRG